MALSRVFKINSIILQNLGRFFSTTRAEPIPVIQHKENSPARQNANASAVKQNVNTSAENTTAKPVVASAGKTVAQANIPPIPYARHTSTTGVERMDSEAKILQKNMQVHQLQPAMLPEYYKSSIDVDAGIFPKPPEGSTEYRHFEKSLTYKHVKLPLKKPRLANPFPDPVKAMPSDTVSDQEKADQMQASARFPSNTPLGNPNTRGFSQFRSYSTKQGGKGGSCGKISSGKNKEKCGKVPKKTCEKIIMRDLPARKRQDCITSFAFERLYAGDLWPPNHDTIGYNNFVTKSSSTRNKPPKRPSSEKLDKVEKTQAKKRKLKRKVKSKKKKTKTQSKNLGMTIVKRKPKKKVSCKTRPPKVAQGTPANPYNFPSLLDNNTISEQLLMTKNTNRTFKRKNKKLKSKMKNSNASSKLERRNVIGQISFASNSRETLTDPLSVQQMPFLLNIDNSMELMGTKIDKDKEKGKKEDDGKCKKFPFDGAKKKPPPPPKDKCPKPKKKKPVKDCPPPNCGGKKQCLSAPALLHFLNNQRIENPSPFPRLLTKKEDKGCPDIDTGTCEDKKEHRCPKEKKEHSKKCPKDLIQKRKRKKHKPPKQTASVD